MIWSTCRKSKRACSPAYDHSVIKVFYVADVISKRLGARRKEIALPDGAKGRFLHGVHVLMMKVAGGREFEEEVWSGSNSHFFLRLLRRITVTTQYSVARITFGKIDWPGITAIVVVIRGTALSLSDHRTYCWKY